MKIVDYGALATAHPIGADAAKARHMRGDGDHNYKVEETRVHSEVPLLTTVVPSNATDYSGAKWGRMTAVGYYGASPKDGGSLWSCRCACGRYETRRGRTIKKANPRDCCVRCSALNRMRRQSFFDAYGKWPEDKA